MPGELDFMNPEAMSADDRLKATQAAQLLLRQLDALKIDANDEKIVWILNIRHGIKDVVLWGYWRKTLAKQPERFRLLLIDEIEEEEAKVAQGRMLADEKRRIWHRLPRHTQEEFPTPEKMSIEELERLEPERYARLSDVDLRQTVAELQQQLKDALEAMAEKGPDKEEKSGKPDKTE